MAATNAQIAELQRMVAEPTQATYLNDILRAYIERYPTLDARGEPPYTLDTSTTPPTQDANSEWMPTYDLHRAAADIWLEKAAALAGNYDFEVEGRKFTRAQTYKQAMGMVRYYRSTRTPANHESFVSPPPLARMVWIGNLAEEDD